MGVDEVSRAPLRPAPDLIALGYTADVLWLRLRVTPLPGDAGTPLLLRVRPVFLDNVQLWEADASAANGWRLRQAGDHVSFLASERTYNAFGFLVHPAPGGQDYWVRVATHSTLMAHAEALPQAQAHRKDGGLVLLHLVNIAVVLCVLCWAFHTWWIGRMALAGWFVLFELSNILYVVLIVGLGAALEPVGWPGLAGQLVSVVTLVANVLIVWLHRELLRAYDARGWSMRLLTLLPVLQLLALPIFLLGWEREGLRLSVSLLLPAALLVITTALRVRSAPSLLPPLVFMKTVHLMLFGGYMLSILPLMGLVHAVEWGLHTNLLHGPLTAFFMLTVLWQHAKLRDDAQRRLAEGVQRLKVQVDIERQLAQNHRQFIDMLTHEVKTPLAIALMSVGALKSDSHYTARIRRALQDINAVVDRTRLSDLVDHQQLQPQWSACALRELLLDCTESSVAPERLMVSAREVPELQTDSGLLAIVINNLLDNALKYSPPDSTVEVRLDTAPGQVRLSVSSAVGPAGQPDPERLFTKYYRAPAAQAKSGSGLGLHLSYQLAGLLQAQLRYQPRPGRVEFELCLPV